MKIGKLNIGIVALGFVSCLASSVQAQQYSFRGLQSVPGYNFKVGQDLNNRRMIAGEAYSVDENGFHLTNMVAVKWNARGEVVSAGEIQENISTNVVAIDRRGRLGGVMEVGGWGRRRAFITDMAGVPQMLPLPGEDDGFLETVLVDMNDRGDAVGSIENDNLEDNSIGAFLFHDGQIRQISDGSVSAINNRGEVLLKEHGELFLVRGLTGHGPLRRVRIPRLGRSHIEGMDLNEHGDVLFTVFNSYDEGSITAIRTRAGQIIRLPLLPGFASMTGVSLNESREVVGAACGLGEEGDEVCDPFLFTRGRLINGRRIIDLRTGAFSRINDHGDILVHSFETPGLLVRRGEGRSSSR